MSGKRTKAGFEPPKSKITRNGGSANSTLADWRRPSFWSWRACVIKLFVWVGILLQSRQTVPGVLAGVVDFSRREEQLCKWSAFNKGQQWWAYDVLCTTWMSICIFESSTRATRWQHPYVFAHVLDLRCRGGHLIIRHAFLFQTFFICEVLIDVCLFSLHEYDMHTSVPWLVTYLHTSSVTVRPSLLDSDFVETVAPKLDMLFTGSFSFQDPCHSYQDTRATAYCLHHARSKS